MPWPNVAAVLLVLLMILQAVAVATNNILCFEACSDLTVLHCKLDRNDEQQQIQTLTMGSANTAISAIHQHVSQAKHVHS